jgi:C4-dicarboxylate-specific signal transduction histidine kinase
MTEGEGGSSRPEAAATPVGPSLRREVLLPFALLFALGTTLAGLAIFLLGPLMRSPLEAMVVLGLIVAGDVAVIFIFARWTLNRAVLDPIQQMVDDAGRIAAGELHSRMGDVESMELRALSGSVNAMADRLIEDQGLLADNVRSLDRTNEELVEARDQVVRSARLASVGTLSAGLAHEIGNPLGALLTFLDATRHRLPPDSDAADVLESARGEAMRIDGIVRSLLEFSRPNAAEAGPFHASDVIEGVRTLLEAQGKTGRVEIRWPDRVEGARLEGDPQHLEQILVNLLLNALDALEGTADPTILISADLAQLEARHEPIRRESDPPGVDYSHRRRVARPPEAPLEMERALQILTIEVADNGPGVPPELLESLFDPFFTTKDPGEGTGLGLAISARLAEGLGGTLTVANRSEGGAAFTLKLPVHPE